MLSVRYEAKYGKGVIPTGLRSGIICISSAVAAFLLSHVILPGLIFGFLSIVEGVITIVDVIRNNKRGKKSMIPLAFSISGIIISLVAIIISVLCAISVLIYLLGLGATGIVAILISLIML